MRVLIAIAAWAACLDTSGALAAQPALTPGTITIEPVDDRVDPPEVRQLYAKAVDSALLDARFLTLPAPNHGRYLARVTVTQGTRGTVAARAQNIGPAVGAGKGGSGVSYGFPTKKTVLRDLVVTELTIEIVLRSTGRSVWHGSALTAQVEGTRTGGPSALAKKLANAVIHGFPAKSETPISVP